MSAVAVANFMKAIPGFCAELNTIIQTNYPWMHRCMVFTYISIKHLLGIVALKMCFYIRVYYDAFRKDGFSGLIKAVGTSIREIVYGLLGNARSAIRFFFGLIIRRDMIELFTDNTVIENLAGYMRLALNMANLVDA